MEKSPTSKTILFIDDDEDDKFFFSEAVDKLGTDVSCIYAVNGQAALDLLSTDTDKPDLIFVDINMPKMGGLEFLKKIKQCPILGKIPVFIYSTSKLESEYEEATLLGALHFFIKPLQIHKIRDCINAALQQAFELQHR